jgi:exosortase/archaeosortase family protein
MLTPHGAALYQRCMPPAPAPSAPRLFWRVGLYLALVGLAVPFLRGNDRVSHGSELAWLTVTTLRALRVDAAQAGDVVSGSGFAMQIAPICDGIDLAVILGLAILLSPAPWRLRIVGLGLALALTQLFNLGRLVCMFLVGVHLREHFDLFHHVLWQGVAILFCVGLYAAWLSRTPESPRG